jgi:hypothetical protein
MPKPKVQLKLAQQRPLHPPQQQPLQVEMVLELSSSLVLVHQMPTVRRAAAGSTVANAQVRALYDLIESRLVTDIVIVGPVVAQERDGGCGFGDVQPNDNAAKALQGRRLGRRGAAFM